ncbi:hypothetical protein K438DRAFT_2020524 [Mycena galopus ATCC 62051]|nr:hypothetical protein K438DRAFT_2020524 [Mycena galopus ATCC 62051]
MVMELVEAIRWAVIGPTGRKLEEMYPHLSTNKERKEAWAADNRDSIREATMVLLAARPDRFPPGTNLEPTGSPFQRSSPGGFIPIYWNPSTIWLEHEAFAYSMEYRARVPANALRHAHPVEPLKMTVHAGWDPLTELPPTLPLPESVSLEGRVRYTLSDWRKRRVHHTAPNILAVQRYYLENYDLKEVLDVEGNVVRSEEGEKYTESRL